MNVKKPWQSKTYWINAIMAVSTFVPQLNEWITSNPSTFTLGVTLLNLGLRSVTGERVSWKLIDKKL
jgi:hypothetical protein